MYMYICSNGALLGAVYGEVLVAKSLEFTDSLIEVTLELVQGSSFDIFFCHYLPVFINWEWWDHIETEEISDEKYSSFIFFVPTIERNYTSIFLGRIEYIQREIIIGLLISDIPRFFVFAETRFFFCEEIIISLCLEWVDFCLQFYEFCVFFTVPIHTTRREEKNWNEKYWGEFHI